MTTSPPPGRRPMSIGEYAEIQRENGSCKEEFARSVTKMTKFGLALGVPFGLYLGYKYHGVSARALSKSVGACLTMVVPFGGLGVFIASFNCLRIKP